MVLGVGLVENARFEWDTLAVSEKGEGSTSEDMSLGKYSCAL